MTNLEKLQKGYADIDIMTIPDDEEGVIRTFFRVVWMEGDEYVTHAIEIPDNSSRMEILLILSSMAKRLESSIFQDERLNQDNKTE